MLFLSAVLAVASLLPFTSSTPLPSKRDLGPVTIFDPPSDYKDQRTLYGRSLLLKHQCDASNNGAILSTWENYTPQEPPYFPIYRSLDGAATWSEYSRVEDQVNGWGLRYQPFLYEVSRDWAGFKKGTILLAGNSIPEDLSVTQIDLYASYDAGCTWSFVSHIATGGEALPNNGLTPVWEPFIYLPPMSANPDDKLIVYYSDQRDPRYGQKLTHQTTSDGYTWDATVDDEVDNGNYTSRPGMPVVSDLGNGMWIFSYEYYGAKEVDFAAYYKLSDSPFTFGQVEGQAVVAEDGYVPSSSPYNVFLPPTSSYTQGVIVLNAGSSADAFLNYNRGAGKWRRVSTKSPASYTRSLDVRDKKTGEVLIVGGGPITGNGTENMVVASVQTFY